MHQFIAAIQKHRAGFCLLVVIFCLAIDFYPRYRDWQGYSNLALNAASYHRDGGVMPDAYHITEGLRNAKTFPDTLKWWSGSWAAGSALTFYRPLTSYFWWFQYRLWGENGLLGFLAVNAVLHAAFVLVLWRLLTRLLGLVPATFSTCTFTLGAAVPLFFMAVPQHALHLWIDTPEMTCGITLLLALWCYTRYLREEPGRWLLAACALYVIGILWKEAAYTFPFFALLLLWYENKWSHWKSLIPIAAITVACFAYRTWALQGRGYHLGSNNSWKERYIMETMGGSVAAMAVNADSLALGVACAVFAAVLWQKGWRVSAGFALAAVFFVMRYLHFNAGVDTPLLVAVLPAFWWKVALCGLFLLLVYRFVLNRTRGQWLGWGWVQAAYVPMLTTPITSHALYFLAVGWGIWLAYALLDLAPWLWAQVTVLKARLLDAYEGPSQRAISPE